MNYGAKKIFWNAERCFIQHSAYFKEGWTDDKFIDSENQIEANWRRTEELKGTFEDVIAMIQNIRTVFKSFYKKL